MQITVNDQITILDGGLGPCELFRSYRVIADTGEEILFEDLLINANDIEVVGKVDELILSPLGNLIRAKIPAFSDGEIEVLKVKAKLNLSQPMPALVLRHAITGQLGALQRSYQCSIQLPFTLDRSLHYELESIHYEPRPPLGATCREINLPEIKIPAEEIRLTLKIKSTIPLPVLRNLGSRFSGTFSEAHILIIPHLLQDFPDFAEALVAAGARKENIYIIGIPYSAQASIVEKLKNDGFLNIDIPQSYPFQECLKTAGDWLMNRFGEIGDGFRWLIIEDGGYFFPFLYEQAKVHGTWKELKAKCYGAVEQTRNGVWAYQDSVPWYERDIPLCSVADARLKIGCESRWIGEAVCRNITDLIKTGGVLQKEGDRVLVIGLGSTGRQIAKEFKQKGWDVKGYDKSAVARAIARGETISIHNDPTPRLMLDGVRIVIGATGKENSIDADLIKSMGDGTIIVNASSKRKEIEWAALGVAGEPDQVGALSRYYFPDRYGNNRLISILAKGFPVNFYAGRSVEPADIELIMSCLFRAAVELVKSFNMPPEKRVFHIASLPDSPATHSLGTEEQKQRGIFMLPDEIEEEISKLWLCC